MLNDITGQERIKEAFDRNDWLIHDEFGNYLKAEIRHIYESIKRGDFSSSDKLTQEMQNAQMSEWDDEMQLKYLSREPTMSQEEFYAQLDKIAKGTFSENNPYLSGEIIPRHKVKGDPQLFHFDHYESTTLTITPEDIRLVDHYFRKPDETISPDSAIFEIIVNQKESITCLLQYFEIIEDNVEDVLDNLYKAMERYAREQCMNSLDSFGLLFKEIGVEFKATCFL